jgi:hypothetical protein
MTVPRLRKSPEQRRIERAWAGLPPERDEAASSTVEALVFELREHGVNQLKRPATQGRLSALSAGQLPEVIGRLERLRPRYPQITDELIAALREQIK